MSDGLMGAHSKTQMATGRSQILRLLGESKLGFLVFYFCCETGPEVDGVGIVDLFKPRLRPGLKKVADRERWGSFIPCRT